MKINIVGRQMNVYEDTRELIEHKLGKLDKYFKTAASPEATVNALENLVLIARGCPTVAVLGDMLELGKYSEMLHRTVGNAVVRNGIDMLFTYGKGALSIAEGAREAGFSPAAIYSFGEDEIAPLADAVCRFAPRNAAVLIKASGRMALGRVTEEIKRRWSDE